MITSDRMLICNYKGVAIYMVGGTHEAYFGGKMIGRGSCTELLNLIDTEVGKIFNINKSHN